MSGLDGLAKEADGAIVIGSSFGAPLRLAALRKPVWMSPSSSVGRVSRSCPFRVRWSAVTSRCSCITVVRTTFGR